MVESPCGAIPHRSRTQGIKPNGMDQIPIKPMLKKIQTSLAYRFVFFVLTFVMAAMLGISLLISVYSYHELKNTTRRDYGLILNSAAGEIRGYMTATQRALETLAHIITYMKPTPDGWEQNIAITAFSQKNPQFTDIKLINTTTGTVTGDQFAGQPNYTATRVYQRAVAGRVAVSAVQRTPYNMPFVRMAVPVKRLGTIEEILWAELNLTSVWDVLNGIKIGKSGYVSVMNADGHYVSHLNIKPVLRRVPRAHMEQLSKIRNTDALTDWMDQKKREFCLATHIPGLDWFIILSQSVDELYSHIYKGAGWVVALMIGGCLAVAFLGTRFVRQMFRPIDALHHQVQRYSSGCWDERVTIESHDEIGSLAASFNDMADALKHMMADMVKNARALARNNHMAVLGDASSKVTHEITNFVNDVRLFLMCLKNGPLDDAQREQLIAGLEAEMDHVETFSRDFLSFAGKTKPRLSRCAPAAVIEQALGPEMEMARQQGVTIVYQWAPDLPAVPLDPNQMCHVITNLVKNSLYALKGQTGENRVIISGKQADGFFHLCVHDNGPGIPAESREKIFKPFFTTKGRDGSGLGLAIIKDIVDAHQGRLEYRCPPGGGSEFRLFFPLNAVADADE